MTTEKIHFTKEKETMLMTLNGRALQSQWKNRILRDPWAEEAMRHIDYDISKQYRGVGSWSLWNKIGCTIIATRAATFDLLTNRYLADHPDATVLHVGCGMDSRVFRVDPQAAVQWFDVDYPDVIDLRRQLFPERGAYHLIGAPLSDLRWLDEVPRDRPDSLGLLWSKIPFSFGRQRPIACSPVWSAGDATAGCLELLVGGEE